MTQDLELRISDVGLGVFNMGLRMQACGFARRCLESDRLFGSLLLLGGPFHCLLRCRFPETSSFSRGKNSSYNRARRLGDQKDV